MGGIGWAEGWGINIRELLAVKYLSSFVAAFVTNAVQQAVHRAPPGFPLHPKAVEQQIYCLRNTSGRFVG